MVPRIKREWLLVPGQNQNQFSVAGQPQNPIESGAPAWRGQAPAIKTLGYPMIFRSFKPAPGRIAGL